MSDLIVFFTLFTKKKKYIFNGSLIEFFTISPQHKNANIANFVLAVEIILNTISKGQDGSDLFRILHTKSFSKSTKALCTTS